MDRTIQVLTSNTADRKMESLYREKKGFRNVLASFLSDKCRKKYGNVYVCTVCCTMYNLQASLKDHIRGAHLNVQKCGHCLKLGKDFVFTTRAKFVTHVKQFHKGMDNSVKSHVVTPRPEARKIYAIDDTATLKQYSKSFLTKALRLYCATEGIELIELSSQEDTLTQMEETTYSQSLRRMTSDLRTEAQCGNALPVCITRSCDRESHEMTSIQDDQDTISSIGEEHFSQCDNHSVSPATLSTTLSDEPCSPMPTRSLFSFFPDSTCNLKDIPIHLNFWGPLFPENANSAAIPWKEACRKLYEESNVEGDVKITTNHCDASVSIHSFIVNLWLAGENETAFTSGTSINLNQEVLIIMKKLMYGLAGHNSVSNHERFEMCQIVDAINKGSNLANYLVTGLERVMSTAIISEWLKESELLNSDYARKLILTHTIKNPTESFHPEGVLLCLPYELLEQFGPQNLCALMCAHNQQINQSLECHYLDMDHCQLLEFLYNWTCEHIEMHPETSPRLLQEKLQKLKDIINPEIFTLHQFPLCHEAKIKLEKASLLYFKLFFGDYDVTFFIRESTKAHETERNTTYRPGVPVNPLQQLTVGNMFSEKLANTIVQTDQGWYLNCCTVKYVCPALLTLTTKDVTGHLCFNLPKSTNIPIFKLFLECCHDPMLSPADPMEMEPLLYLAILFRVDHLKQHLYNSLKHRVPVWTPAMGILMLQTAIQLNHNHIVSNCIDFVTKNISIVLETEAFYTATDKKTIQMILQRPRKNHVEKQLICAVHKWCLVQSALKPSTYMENLKSDMKGFLHFEALSPESRISVQEETNFLSVREYDKLCVTYATHIE